MRWDPGTNSSQMRVCGPICVSLVAIDEKKKLAY